MADQHNDPAQRLNHRLPKLSALDAHRIHSWLWQELSVEVDSNDLGQILLAIHKHGYEYGREIGYIRGKQAAAADWLTNQDKD